MAYAKIHQSFPCGYQESFEGRGWFIIPKPKARELCPFHGDHCKRGA